jgi:hypothetical protein
MMRRLGGAACSELGHLARRLGSLGEDLQRAVLSPLLHAGCASRAVGGRGEGGREAPVSNEYFNGSFNVRIRSRDFLGPTDDSAIDPLEIWRRRRPKPSSSEDFDGTLAGYQGASTNISREVKGRRAKLRRCGVMSNVTPDEMLEVAHPPPTLHHPLSGAPTAAATSHRDHCRLSLPTP